MTKTKTRHAENDMRIIETNRGCRSRSKSWNYLLKTNLSISRQTTSC